MLPLVWQLEVSFKVIPVREWSEEVLSNEMDLLDLQWIEGNLEVDLKILEKLKGSFKTAHPCWIISPAKEIPACFTSKICVKQFYS